MLRLILSTAFVLCLSVTSSWAQAAIETLAKQAIIVDYDTGTVLYEKNADEQMPTSSMSKVLTAYVVFDAIKNGKISLSDTYNVSEKAWNMQGSKMFVELGKQISIDDLIHGVIIQSGNDACVVLAEGLAGSEENFAGQMNKYAAQIGMPHSHFANASGWPDPEHYSTARDLSVLAHALIHDFPEYYSIYSQKEFTYHGIKQGNRNPLLYANIGADGMKTGHTDIAGYGLIGSGTSNGRRVILVVNGLSSMDERAQEGSKLLVWGLNNFENIVLFKNGQTIDKAAVVLGRETQVPLVVDRDMVWTVSKSNAARPALKAVYKAPLMAPVKKGDRVGTLFVQNPGAEKPQEIPLLAGADVQRPGFLKLIMAKINLLLGGA